MGRYNDAAFDQYNTQSLEPCPRCGRTFNTDALPRHMKGCHAKGERSAYEVEKEKESLATPGTKKPKSLICYICGKEYGTQSLEIHVKVCKKKWEIE